MPEQPNRKERMSALIEEMRRCGWRGLELEGGWVGILEEFLSEVSDIPGGSLSVVQIKEKFGTLRIYCRATEPYEERVALAKTRAEAKSSVTCLYCGCRGRMRNNGWYSVMCDVHDLAYKAYCRSVNGPSPSEMPGEDDPVSAYALIVRPDLRQRQLVEFIDLRRGGMGDYLGPERIALAWALVDHHSARCRSSSCPRLCRAAGP